MAAGFRPEYQCPVGAGEGFNLALDLVEHLGADKQLITMNLEGHFTDQPSALAVGLKTSSNLRVFGRKTGFKL